MSLVADPKRIRTLQGPYEDYHKFIDSRTGIGERIRLFVRHQFRSYYFMLPPLYKMAWRSLSWEKRMVPDFTSIGSVRSGTSSLSNYILQHPAVLLPLVKEIAPPVPTMAFVRGHFPKKTEALKVKEKYGIAMTGICTPSVPNPNFLYMTKAVNPNIKTVVILRDPVDRVISMWRWNQYIMGTVKDNPLWACMPDFKEAMRFEFRELRENGCGLLANSGAGKSSYLRHSIYLPYLMNLYDHFPADRILVINANDFFADAVTVAKSVYRFLGLPDYEPVEVEETNASPPLDLDEEIKQELIEFFRPYNEKLYTFMGKDLGWKC